MKKALLVLPKNSIEQVKELLNKNKINYEFEPDKIFANLSNDLPPGLEDIAEVIDPIFQRDDKWFFQLPDDELSNPFDNEDQCRRAFVVYISWGGEFVRNSEEL